MEIIAEDDITYYLEKKSDIGIRLFKKMYTFNEVITRIIEIRAVKM